MANTFDVSLHDFMKSVLQQLANREGVTLSSPSQEVVNFMISWAHIEGGSVTNEAHFNPLNTMQEEEGSVKFGTTEKAPGVQAYPDATTGEKATIDALSNGHYKNLVRALSHQELENLGLKRRGSPFFAFMMSADIAQELSLWSGHGGDIIAAQQYLVNLLQGAGITNASIQGGRVSGGQGQNQETIDTWGSVSLGKSITGSDHTTSSFTSNDIIKIGIGILCLLIGSALFIKAQFPTSGVGRVVSKVFK